LRMLTVASTALELMIIINVLITFRLPCGLGAVEDDWAQGVRLGGNR